MLLLQYLVLAGGLVQANPLVIHQKRSQDTTRAQTATTGQVQATKPTQSPALQTTARGFQIAAQSDCTSGARIINGRQCVVTCNQARNGADIPGALQRTNSWEGCVQLCAENADCVSAQYHKDNGFCYPKNARNNLTPSENENTIDCRPVSRPVSSTTTKANVAPATTTKAANRPSTTLPTSSKVIPTTPRPSSTSMTGTTFRFTATSTQTSSTSTTVRSTNSHTTSQSSSRLTTSTTISSSSMTLTTSSTVSIGGSTASSTSTSTSSTISSTTTASTTSTTIVPPACATLGSSFYLRGEGSATLPGAQFVGLTTAEAGYGVVYATGYQLSLALFSLDAMGRLMIGDFYVGLTQVVDNQRLTSFGNLADASASGVLTCSPPVAGLPLLCSATVGQATYTQFEFEEARGRTQTTYFTVLQEALTTARLIVACDQSAPSVATTTPSTLLTISTTSLSTTTAASSASTTSIATTTTTTSSSSAAGATQTYKFTGSGTGTSADGTALFVVGSGSKPENGPYTGTSVYLGGGASALGFAAFTTFTLDTGTGYLYNSGIQVCVFYNPGQSSTLGMGTPDRLPLTSCSASAGSQSVPVQVTCRIVLGQLRCSATTYTYGALTMLVINSGDEANDYYPVSLSNGVPDGYISTTLTATSPNN